jgi:hypothetical protein
MAEPNRVPRRWISGLLLLTSMLMLLAGQTFLAPTLTGWSFVGYWLVCFLVTGAAGIAGVLELSALRRRWSSEQHQVIEDALKEVERMQREKAGPSSQKGGGS